ncbi:uncharacterized protein LJ264_014502 [Porphyrio hochstetteri]
MARAKQAVSVGGKRPCSAPSPPQDSPKPLPSPPRARPLWEKLRLSQRKPLKLFPAASIHVLVRSFPSTGRKWLGAGAAAALREGCEAHLLAVLEEWGLCALHAKRSVVRMADVSLVRCLRVRRG